MKTQFFLACALALPTLSIALPQSADAAAAVPKISIGVAATYCALGATTVTNTGNTVCNRDVGVYPGTAITGFPPGTGTLHPGDASAKAAQTAAHAAYTSAVALPPTATLTGDLGGKTLTPGVYRFSSSAQLTGTLTLNGQNDKNAQFVFQIGSTITTASAAKVVLINGARACHVIWAVGSSATLGTTTAFQGDVLAVTSITATTGVSNVGSLIALGAAVTLDTNKLTAVPTCPTL